MPVHHKSAPSIGGPTGSDGEAASLFCHPALLEIEGDLGGVSGLCQPQVLPPLLLLAARPASTTIALSLDGDGGRMTNVPTEGRRFASELAN